MKLFTEEFIAEKNMSCKKLFTDEFIAENPVMIITKPKVKRTRQPAKPKEPSHWELKSELEKEQENLWFLEAERLKQEEEQQKFKQDVVIDNDFIMREDLHEWLFIEDSEGKRYRERIMDKIKEFGIENWFKAKGYPLNEDSIWKNRHTASLTTLKEDIHHFDNEFRTGTFETQGYFLWENWLPLEIWNEKEMNLRNLYTEITLSKSKITELKAKLWKKREPFHPLVRKWADFIISLTKERGQEIDLLWFSESAPYECAIEVRLRGHHCYCSCVNFRFENNELRAYDSDFGGGTSMIRATTDEEISKEITEVMEKVFNKECEASEDEFFRKTAPYKRKQVILDENGWILNYGEDIEL